MRSRPPSSRNPVNLLIIINIIITTEQLSKYGMRVGKGPLMSVLGLCFMGRGGTSSEKHNRPFGKKKPSKGFCLNRVYISFMKIFFLAVSGSFLPSDYVAMSDLSAPHQANKTS